MSPENQRIAIAHECGWESFPGEKSKAYNPDGLSCYWSDAPDYLNDLNAMHEAEGSLSEEHKSGYALKLMATFNLGRFGLAHATAAQRAEAFLKTIGKWTA